MNGLKPEEVIAASQSMKRRMATTDMVMIVAFPGA
jgi:hypothetical protein